MAAEFSELFLKCSSVVKTGSPEVPEVTEDGEIDVIFSKEDIRILKGLPLDKRNDSTFILQCLKFSYKDDLTFLTNKSVNGTASVVEVSDEGKQETILGKDPLTPQKVARIRQLFIERLSACDVDAATFRARIKDSKVNHLMGTGINNICKKYK